VEAGAGGTLPPDASIRSIERAVKYQTRSRWATYSFATNARYSAVGHQKIQAAAERLKLDPETISFLGPEYWNDLCVKNERLVRDRFYYRVTASEKDVINAFKNAGYFEKYVAGFAEKIHERPLTLRITNNRTPVEIEIPFSPELTVENYLDVAKQLLGLTLDWTNFPDLGTAAGLSLSVSIDQYAQTFDKKIGDLPLRSGDSLQLWIQIVWRDRLEESAPSDQASARTHLSLRAFSAYTAEVLRKTEVPTWPKDRKGQTIQRQETLIESMIWNRFSALSRAQTNPENDDIEKVYGSLGVHLFGAADLDAAKRRLLEQLVGQSLGGQDRIKIELLRPNQKDELS